jgi:hypothetical protein
VRNGMSRAIKALAVAAFSIGFLVLPATAQQAGTGPGGGRKHHEQKADTAASTTPKADDKAYNAALKSLPNKPYDPWSGTR